MGGRELWYDQAFLSFDTATEVGLLGISAAEASKGLTIWSIMVFPAFFTAGMALIDTTEGVLMLGAYGWAFAKPLRKLYYNITITSVSVLVALISWIVSGALYLQALRRDRGPRPITPLRRPEGSRQPENSRFNIVVILRFLVVQMHCGFDLKRGINGYIARLRAVHCFCDCRQARRANGWTGFGHACFPSHLASDFITPDRSPKILEIGTFLLFGGLSLYSCCTVRLGPLLASGSVSMSGY